MAKLEWLPYWHIYRLPERYAGNLAHIKTIWAVGLLKLWSSAYVEEVSKNSIKTGKVKRIENNRPSKLLKCVPIATFVEDTFSYERYCYSSSDPRWCICKPKMLSSDQGNVQRILDFREHVSAAGFLHIRGLAVGRSYNSRIRIRMYVDVYVNR